jgi:hypothetical protein
VLLTSPPQTTAPVEESTEPATPAVPYLPAVGTKAPEPSTGVELTLAEAMLRAHNPATVRPAAKEKKKKGRRRIIVLGILILVGAPLAVVFRDSPFLQRFTGKGYDTNPLPTGSAAQPPVAGIEFSITTQSVAMMDGLPTNLWNTERDTMDFTAGTARRTFDRATASVIGGTISSPQTDSSPFDIVLDKESTYEPGATPTDPWIRRPHIAGWFQLATLTRNQLLMYQDVFDPTLRAQPPMSVTTETRHDVAVTTYTYTFTFGNFYESAPRLFDLVQQMDGNADPEAQVTVTVSLDKESIVRYLDVNLDYHDVLEYRAKADVGVPYPYRYTVDLLSTSDTPPDVGVPTNVVDAPAEATTTTTVAP